MLAIEARCLLRCLKQNHQSALAVRNGVAVVALATFDILKKIGKPAFSDRRVEHCPDGTSVRLRQGVRVEPGRPQRDRSLLCSVNHLPHKNYERQKDVMRPYTIAPSLRY